MRTAAVSVRGIFNMPFRVYEPFEAWLVLDASAESSALKCVGSGWLWMMRMVPATAPDPYKVPWGPRNTSTRSTSVIVKLTNRGTSST